MKNAIKKMLVKMIFTAEERNMIMKALDYSELKYKRHGRYDDALLVGIVKSHLKKFLCEDTPTQHEDRKPDIEVYEIDGDECAKCEQRDKCFIYNVVCKRIMELEAERQKEQEEKKEVPEAEEVHDAEKAQEATQEPETKEE